MNNNPAEVENADQSFEHIYTSIHSAGHLPAKQSDYTPSNSAKSNNSSSQKPPIRVLSPECFRGSQSQGKNRCTRSASPGLPVKGHNSCSPKPPVKVLSLYLLSPVVKSDSETNIKCKNLKISENLMKENVNMDSVDKTGNTDKSENHNGNKEFQEHNGDADYVANHLQNGFHDFDETCNNDNDQEPNGICDKILETAERASNILNGNSEGSNSKEHRVAEKGFFSKTAKGDNSVKSKNVDPGGDNFILQPKNVVEDNFLTEDEIKEEITAAQLY